MAPTPCPSGVTITSARAPTDFDESAERTTTSHVPSILRATRMEQGAAAHGVRSASRMSSLISSLTATTPSLGKVFPACVSSSILA